jgi:alkaline phosphatase D
MHTGKEIESLDDYRNRYALYKCDPDLQAAHAAFPWIVTWDDHEVDNNYAGAVSERQDPIETFRVRRGNAYRAYYEHMPLGRASLPRGPALALYRRLGYGRLAQFHVLDGRQYRTDQPCGDGRKPLCAEAWAEAATMLGAEQERWLFDGLAESPAGWNVLANQTLIAQLASGTGEQRTFSMDNWNGYPAARRRLMDFLGQRRPSNPVAITGDIHSNWVADLKRDFDDPQSATVGAEFVGTSISSGGDGADLSDFGRQAMRDNPHVRFFNGQRGYVSCDLTRGLFRANYRVVEYVSQPDAPIKNRAVFVVEDGRPGAVAG